MVKAVDFPEQQLLSTLKAGDITAFEMLFRTYYQPLCNYAYTFVQDRDEAEEVVQSTFTSVWEKKEGIEIHTAMKPYLYAMVRNACLNLIKHQKIKKAACRGRARHGRTEYRVRIAHGYGFRARNAYLPGDGKVARAVPPRFQAQPV